MTRKGRPRAPIDLDVLVADRAAKLSWPAIARKHGVGVATAYRAFEFWKGRHATQDENTTQDQA
jgi:hypothetical protein